jgi:hypothetical protein
VDLQSTEDRANSSTTADTGTIVGIVIAILVLGVLMVVVVVRQRSRQGASAAPPLDIPTSLDNKDFEIRPSDDKSTGGSRKSLFGGHGAPPSPSYVTPVKPNYAAWDAQMVVPSRRLHFPEGASVSSPIDL